MGFLISLELANTSDSSVQFNSVTQLCLTLCDPMDCRMPGLPVHHQLPEFTQTHVHWVGEARQPSHPLSFSCLQSFPASGSFQMSHLFASGVQSIGVSASASVLPMNIQDWFPLGWTGWILAVQGTLKSLLQHHSSKASILWHSAFFIVQLSHPYMTTGKILQCEMFDAFPLKTGTCQRCMLSLIRCKNSLEHRVRTVHIKGTKKYDYWKR